MKYIAATVTMVLWLFLAWYGGAELLERSFDNAVTVGLGITTSIWVYFYPGYEV